MADEKESEGSPWAPVGLLALIIGGAFLYLYVTGNLSKLNTKDLLLPPPTQTQTTPTQQTNTNTYAEEQLQQNTYTVDPNPIQTNQP